MLKNSLMYHVLSKNRRAKDQLRHNEHLIKENNTLRKSIDLCAFDVTLLVALIKNVNRTNCFNDFRNICNNTSCTDCFVKVAVEDIRKLRNSAAHETDYQLEGFLNQTRQFHDFPGLGTFKIFMEHFEKQFHILHTHISDAKKFPLSSLFGK